MSEIQSVNQETVVEAPYTYGGFWKRFAASIIDSFILSLLYGATDYLLEEEQTAFFTFFAWWLYYAVLESSKLQGTLGKRALGMLVTDLQGRRISFARASGRNFAKFVSMI